MNHRTPLAFLLVALAGLAFTGCEPATIYYGHWPQGLHYVTSKDGTPTELIPSLGSVIGLACSEDGQQLYVAHQSSILRMGTDGTNGGVVIQTGRADCVALDDRAGRIYWADINSNHIASCNLQGADVRVLVTGVNLPTAVAVNPSRGLLYWSQAHPERGVWMARLDGSQKRRLSDETSFPRPLAVDRLSGRLFWATHDPTRIIAANHDGSDPKTIATLTNRRVEGLAVDERANRIVWIERRSDPALPDPALIRSARFDGSDVTTLHPFTDGDYALSLAIGPARSKP